MRLPTYREDRFMVYYSILAADVDQIANWAYYRLEQAEAVPTDPYPYDGNQWFQDVATPLTSEVNTYTNAINNGVIVGAVAVNNNSVEAKRYHDPQTNNHYLLSVDTDYDSENVTFTLDSADQFQYARPMCEDGIPIPIVNGVFSDSFNDFSN